MKKGLTLLVFVMDRSGSMGNIIFDSIGGFNSLIDKQKTDCLAEGNTAKVSLVIFDDKIDTIYNYKNIIEVPELTDKIFYARGMTALTDAVCRTINTVGGTLKDLSENDRPEKVIFTIITDGHENASREFQPSQLKFLIKEQEDKYNWVFNFIGANIDSINTSGQMGVSNTRGVSNYVASASGVRAMFKGVSNYTTNLRNSAIGDTTFMSIQEEITELNKQ